jgi:SPP1 family predicted phage head-tail adaptor
MRAGRLRHRVTIQTPSRTRNGAGEQTVSWSDSATVSARVESLNGNEYENDKQMSADITHRVTIRWHPSVSVDATKRFKFVTHSNTRYLQIIAANNPEEQDREIVCNCKEVKA